MALHWDFNPLGIGGYGAYPGERGVIIYSGGDIKLQAMTVSNGTVGSNQLGDVMEVYSLGRALDYTVSNGSAVVYDGGYASALTQTSSGRIVVYSNGIVDALTALRGPFAIAISGGTLNNLLINGQVPAYCSTGVVNSADITYGQLVAYDIGGVGPVFTHITARGSNAASVSGTVQVRAHCYASDVTISSGGYLPIWLGGVCEDITISSAGRMYVSGNGYASNVVVMQGGTATMVGGTLTSAVAVSGGTIYLSGGSAIRADFAGGSGRVYAGGTLMNITASSGAMLAVTGEGAHISGGTVYGRLDSTADAATVSTRIYVNSGGLVEDLVLDGPTASNTNWAKAVLYVLAGGIASNIHAMGSSYYGGSISVSSGGSAIDCEIHRYGFYIYTGGTAIRPVVSGVAGAAQLYAYTGATVYDINHIRGTVSAHSGSYLSGGSATAGIQTWGIVSNILFSASKSGTTNLRGSLEVRHGNAASASSAHIGTATDIINQGGVVTIYGGTMHTMLMQPELEATNLGATATVRNHADNAVVNEDRVGYLTDVVVSGAQTSGGVRSLLYVNMGGVVSGAHIYNSGCLAVNSGGYIEDLHISNNCPNYAVNIYGGASASGIYRTGTHQKIPAVMWIGPGAVVHNVHNTGGGDQYSILNHGILSGYYGSTIVNASGALERSYIYCQSKACLYDAYLYGPNTSMANSIMHDAFNLSGGMVSHVEVASDARLALTLTRGASAYNIQAVPSGWAVTTVSSGCLLSSASGCVTAQAHTGGTITDVLWDIDAPVSAGSPATVIYAGGYASNVVVKGSAYRGLKFNITGSADDIGCYGGAPGGNGVVFQVNNGGVVSSVSCGPYSGAATFTRIYGSAYNWVQTGGWLYINNASATTSAYLSGGTLFKDDTQSTYHMNTVVWRSATISNVSALSTESSFTRYCDTRISSGALSKDTFQVGGYWQVFSTGVVSNHVLSGGGRLSNAASGLAARPAYFIVQAGGSAYNISAITSGLDSDNQGNRCWVQASSGGYISGLLVSGDGGGGASGQILTGASGDNLTNYHQLNINGSASGVYNNGTTYIGGTNLGGYAVDVHNRNAWAKTVIRTTGTVPATGPASAVNITVHGGTVMVGINGTGVSAMVYKSAANTSAKLLAYEGGLISSAIASSGGLIEILDGVVSTAVISSGGSCIVSSGGQLYDVTVASSGTLQILDGADVVSGITILPADPVNFVSLYASQQTNLYGTITVSGAQVHLACTVEDIFVCSAGVAVASSGCNIMGGTINNSGSLVRLTDSSTASNMLVFGDGTQTGILTVSGGAVLYDSIASSGGLIRILDGGSGLRLSSLSPNITGIYPGILVASGGHLESGYGSGRLGRIYVVAGGVASHIVNEASCETWISAGGSADDVVASASVVVHGTVTNGTAKNAWLFVRSAGTLESAHTEGTGKISVENSGYAHNLTINSTGSAIVNSGGLASSVNVSSGGLADIKGGVISAAHIKQGGIYQVSGGGVASTTTVSSGGSMFISSGGVASNADASGGAIYVMSYGSADVLHVSSGGRAYLYNTGSMTNTSIGGLGRLSAFSGASITGLYIEGTANDQMGGAYISAGAVCSSALVSAGGWLGILGSAYMPRTGGLSTHNGSSVYYGIVSTVVGASAVIESAQVQGEAWANSNGQVIHAHNSGGTLFVYGGTLTSAINSAGSVRIAWKNTYPSYAHYISCYAGAVSVSANGSADNVFMSGGILHVMSGGYCEQATVYTGAICSVYTGGVASALSVSGGTVLAYTEGMVSGINIVANGVLSANAGCEVYELTASAATDLTKASIVLDPSAMAYGTITVDHARAHLAGTIESFTASNSAIVVAKEGCMVMDCYVEGYDTEFRVESGATVDTIWVEGAGKIYISAGGVVSATDAHQVIGTATVSNGGYLHIGEYAYFEYFICLSGGTVYVHDYAEYDDYETEPGAVIIWGD